MCDCDKSCKCNDQTREKALTYLKAVQDRIDRYLLVQEDTEKALQRAYGEMNLLKYILE